MYRKTKIETAAAAAIDTTTATPVYTPVYTTGYVHSIKYVSDAELEAAELEEVLVKVFGKQGGKEAAVLMMQNSAGVFEMPKRETPKQLPAPLRAQE